MKRDRVFAVVAALALAVPPVLAAPAAADITPQACTIYADTPWRDTNHIMARAGRTGCSNTVNMVIRLRQDRSFWPDRTLQEQHRTVINHDGLVSFPCLGVGGTMKVFSETIVGSQKVQSRHVELPCQ